MTDLTAKQVEDRFFQLSAKGAYSEALELVTRHAGLFPNHAQGIVYFWRIETACHLNDTALALLLLEEAVSRGHWFTRLDENPLFRPLDGLPEFEKVLATFEQMRADAIAEADSISKVLQPRDQPPPYPLLLALHGNSSNVESFSHHWHTAVAHGWLVGLPQSPQAYGPGTYSWNDWDWVVPEVESHFASLRAQYPVECQRAALAGFSMGGGLATWLTLSGTIKVRGFIAVAPFLCNVDHILPLLEQRKEGELRAYLVASERDEYCLGVAQKLAGLLPTYGIKCELAVYPDLGHSFPPPFEREIPDALDFISGS